MKKILTAVALTALAATAAYAGSNPGTGVLGSPHDMNVVTGLQADNQGRVCAFCHTPHHAVDLAGQYNPLWSHTPTNLSNVTAYESPTFDAANATGAPVVDPLIGPSRLCMSCHDGAIAPDQHYGSANFTTGGRFASDEFNYTGAKNIAVGLGGNFGNDHPIGFDIDMAIAQDGLGQNGSATGSNGLTPGLLTATWKGNTNAAARTIGQGMYTAPSGTQYMTCASCHDVHNKDNAVNVDYTGPEGTHTDTLKLNYFVYAPQAGSQLCLSCHNK
ncbi:MAG: cytochrome c3 family protein [Desulfuromonadaceae bacterium]|nr:cytochrome c3 family protein [Desulfuromonadaceae bacterium]MDD5106947.1 cytochrome c3 family protein [Desulfuromonadaceae bacterium]